MAARTRKVTHDDKTREKIRTSQLLNRLQDHVFGGEGKKAVDISQTQMKAIEILLRKSLPDLSAVELSGNEDKPIVTQISWQE
jgi:hypothetical protein